MTLLTKSICEQLLRNGRIRAALAEDGSADADFLPVVGRIAAAAVFAKSCERSAAPSARICCNAATNFLAMAALFRVSMITKITAEEKLMTVSKEKTKLILEAGSEAVVVRGNIRVEFNAGGVAVYEGDRPVAVTRIGAEMPDGTIYAGISPDTNKTMFTTPDDAPLELDWRQATDYAASLDAHGHHDWRLPTKAELRILFSYQAAIGGFKKARYWSSSQELGNSQKIAENYAWSKRFTDGLTLYNPITYTWSLRCIR